MPAGVFSARSVRSSDGVKPTLFMRATTEAPISDTQARDKLQSYNVPSQTIKSRQSRERIKAGQHVRMVRFGQRLFINDLFAVKFAVRELQTHPFRHIIHRRAHAARRRLRIGIALELLD